MVGGNRMKCKATWIWDKVGWQATVRTEDGEHIVIVVPSDKQKYRHDSTLLPYGEGEIVRSKKKEILSLELPIRRLKI